MCSDVSEFLWKNNNNNVLRNDMASSSSTTPEAEPNLLKRKRSNAKYEWTCPVCFEELGSPGMIPCALTSCRYSVHLVCLACFDSLQKKECPVCRDPIGSSKPMPITDLVDPNDAEAQKKLDNRFPRVDASSMRSKTISIMKMRVSGWQSYQSIYKKTNDAKIRAKEQLHAARIGFIVDRVGKFIETEKNVEPGEAWTLSDPNPPEFETEVKWKPATSLQQRASIVDAMFKTLEKDIEDIFKDSDLKVELPPYGNISNYPKKPKICYMRILVTVPLVDGLKILHSNK